MTIKRILMITGAFNWLIALIPLIYGVDVNTDITSTMISTTPIWINMTSPLITDTKPSTTTFTTIQSNMSQSTTTGIVIMSTITMNYTMIQPRPQRGSLPVPIEYIIGMSAAAAAIIAVVVIIIVCWRRQKTTIQVSDTQDTAWDNLSLNYIDNPQMSKDSWGDVSDDSAYLATFEDIIAERSSRMMTPNPSVV